MLYCTLSKRHSTMMSFALYLPRGIAVALSETLLSFVLGAAFENRPAQHTRTNLNLYSGHLAHTVHDNGTNFIQRIQIHFDTFQLSSGIFPRPHLTRSDFISLHHTRYDHRSRSKDSCAGKSCAPCGVRPDAELSRRTRQSSNQLV